MASVLLRQPPGPAPLVPGCSCWRPLHWGLQPEPLHLCCAPRRRAALFPCHGGSLDAALGRGTLDSECKPVWGPYGCARLFPTPTSSTAPSLLVLCYSRQAWCPRRGGWPVCPPSGIPGGPDSPAGPAVTYLGNVPTSGRLSGRSRLPAGLCCLSVCPKAVSPPTRGQAVLSGCVAGHRVGGAPRDAAQHPPSSAGAPDACEPGPGAGRAF